MGEKKTPSRAGNSRCVGQTPPPSPPKKKARKSTTIGKSSYVKNFGKTGQSSGFTTGQPKFITNRSSLY
jgi:hypothetical protein